MAYYPVATVEEAMEGFRNKISILCSIFYMLDDWRKIVLLMYLAEYVTVKYRSDVQIRGDQYYISHADTVKRYEIDMKETVNSILYARDTTCHAPDTKIQKVLWNKVWSEDHVERLLKYEGFM